MPRRGANVWSFSTSQPRDEFLKSKLGSADYVSLQGDVLDLPVLTGIIKAHDIDTVLHTAAIIAGRVAQEGYWAFTSISRAPSM